MKISTILFLLTLSLKVVGQPLKVRNMVWLIPATDTKINGLAGGLIINSLKEEGDSLTTIVNGVTLELVGVGLFVPLTPSDPMFMESDSIYRNMVKRDSIIKQYHKIKYKINGLALSGGGLGGHNIGVNGLSISGINSLTGKVNGVSIGTLINYSGIVHGISIAGMFNGTIYTKGLQIGIFNRTTKLRGFQIGLWNVNEKRKLPIINWNFR